MYEIYSLPEHPAVTLKPCTQCHDGASEPMLPRLGASYKREFSDAEQRMIESPPEIWIECPRCHQKTKSHDSTVKAAREWNGCA